MKNLKLLSLIQNFFTEHLSQERGLSTNTILSYRDAIKDYLKYVCSMHRSNPSKIKPEWLTVKILNDYLNFLEYKRGLSVRTRNQRLAAIKSLFTYLGNNDLSNIAYYQKASMIRAKRQPYKIMDYLTEYEMNSLLKVSTHSNPRHHLIISLLYNTGGRVQEICDLCFADIIFGPPPSIYLKGKGNKRRQVPIWSSTAELLKSELLKRKVDPSSNAPIILNKYSRKMSRFGMLFILKQLAIKAADQCPSIKRKKISPHIIRHTTAMHLLQSGIDVSLIKTWLGHVSINTTHGYIEFDVEMKRKALIKAKKFKTGAEINTVIKKHKDIILWLESL